MAGFSWIQFFHIEEETNGLRNKCFFEEKSNLEVGLKQGSLLRISHGLNGHFGRGEKVEETASLGPLFDHLVISDLSDWSQGGILTFVPGNPATFAIANFWPIKRQWITGIWLTPQSIVLNI